MNMFLVHGKNGIYINRCIPQVDNDGSNSKPLCEDDIVNNLTVECVWSLDRFVRLCSCSLSGDVAIVDDRVGLSLLHLKSGVHSNLSVDTLRGVGKFKNIYTPLGCKNIKHLQWSQNGIYLVVYFNLSSYSDGGTDNLHIWNITRKNIIGTFNIRRLLPEQWPVIKWIGLSDNFILCSNNQISIYSLPTTDVSALKSIRSLYTIQINRVFSVEAFLQSVHHSRDTIFINGDGSNSLTSSYSDFTVNNIIHMAGFIPADVSLHLNGCLRMSTITCSDTLATETNIRLHELKYADSAELLWSPPVNI